MQFTLESDTRLPRWKGWRPRSSNCKKKPTCSRENKTPCSSATTKACCRLQMLRVRRLALETPSFFFPAPFRYVTA